jgi:hypothetical protein
LVFLASVILGSFPVVAYAESPCVPVVQAAKDMFRTRLASVREDEIQAPRRPGTAKVREDEIQAPGGPGVTEEEIQAPRAGARGREEETQAPRARVREEEIQAPRSESRLATAWILIEEADAACRQGNTAIAVAKAKASMEILK